MASPTQWTWVWASSRSKRWAGQPGMLQSMELQNQTWLSNWTELNYISKRRLPCFWTNRNPPTHTHTKHIKLSFIFVLFLRLHYFIVISQPNIDSLVVKAVISLCVQKNQDTLIISDCFFPYRREATSLTVP